MKIIRRELPLTSGATLILLAFLAVTALGQHTIVVGPNVLVSRDGDVAHVESHVAANPRNPRNLLGTAITFTSPMVGTETKAYASFDGGWTWTDRYFPDQRQQGAWDPQVAFGVTGTAYLVTMIYMSDSKTFNRVAFYRSEDGGRTWSKPVYFGSRGYDRPVIVVDNSLGRFRGRVYIAVHDLEKGGNGVQLFRSTDDGRTFRGPFSTGCGAITNLLTLSDGTLWIPCLSSNAPKSSYVAKMSVDGGATLSPIVGTPLESRLTWERKPGEVSGFLLSPVYAVDTTARFRDRIYALWLQGEGEDSVHVMLKYSSDRGVTWSEPRKVAPVSKEGARQYLPMAAVNRNGVLGVMWFEALPPGNDTYDVFFTASVDGGESFLPQRRVTSATSQPDHPENRARTQIGGIRSEQQFYSAYSRWKDAGDYTGLTADSDGVFHAFWPDARRGAFQLYTSRIIVESKPTDAGPLPALEAALAVDPEVAVEFGPPIISRPGSDQIIIARIRNVSSRTIWGPLTVTVTATLSGLGRLLESTHDPKIILDPASGQWSKQARIDYTAALRDIPFLAHGAATEAIEWRFRNVSAGQLNLTTHVYAGGAPRQ